MSTLNFHLELSLEIGHKPPGGGSWVNLAEEFSDIYASS